MDNDNYYQGWLEKHHEAMLIAATNLRDYLTNYPVAGFSVPDEIWAPFIKSLQ